MPAPREVVRRGFGRIGFGHSEPTGFQAWSNGYEEGRRAAHRLIERFLA